MHVSSLVSSLVHSHLVSNCRLLPCSLSLVYLCLVPISRRLQIVFSLTSKPRLQPRLQPCLQPRSQPRLKFSSLTVVFCLRPQSRLSMSRTYISSSTDRFQPHLKASPSAPSPASSPPCQSFSYISPRYSQPHLHLPPSLQPRVVFTSLVFLLQGSYAPDCSANIEVSELLEGGQTPRTHLFSQGGRTRRRPTHHAPPRSSVLEGCVM